MRRFAAPVVLLSLGLSALSASAADAPAPAAAPAAAAKPAAGKASALTEDDKTFYTLGQLISKNLEAFQLSPKELQLVQSGLQDGVQGKPSSVDLETYAPKVQALHGTRMAALAAKEKSVGEAYLAKAGAEKGATKTKSGLVIKTVTAGTGATPAAADQVKVHYEGRLIDGTVFDSSIKRGEPATFPLNGVIPCWTEALQLMKVGGKSRIVCPSDIAYGERGSPPQIRPNSTLIFDVQLLDVVKAKPTPPAPVPPSPSGK